LSFARETHSGAHLQMARVRDSSPLWSVVKLAKVVGSNRTATAERLRQFAARGAIEKDPQGRWKLKEEPRQEAQSAKLFHSERQPDPIQAPST
jgi:DNA-binding IclR family transcriptional regulator